MMACRRRVSVSFWATGWSCTIPIRPTWATGGGSRGPPRSSGASRGGTTDGGQPVHLRRERDAVTDTALRLRRLGGPHARARAGAVLLTSAGVAFAIAGAGLTLAPRVAAVVVAWLLIAGTAGAAVWLVRRAGRPAAAAAVGRLVETTAGTRAGSVVGVLAPGASAGASAELLGLADARAAAVVERAAPAVGRP